MDIFDLRPATMVLEIEQIAKLSVFHEPIGKDRVILSRAGRPAVQTEDISAAFLGK